jgi:endonuclease YncB( thermonuclease family)
MAWWNRKYAHEQNNTDATRYRDAEYVARKKHLGLWSQKNPVPPWRWRYSNPREPDKVRPWKTLRISNPQPARCHA